MKSAEVSKKRVMACGIVAFLATLAFLPGSTNAAVSDPEGIRTEAVAVAKSKLGQVAGTAFTCGSYALGFALDDVYVYKDRIQGQQYSASVLYGVTTGGVRVAWNDQIPYTFTAVRVIFTSGSYVNDKTFDMGVTGECGVFMGKANGGSFSLKIEFAGINVYVTDAGQEEHSLTVTVMSGGRFKVSLTDIGAEVIWRFGECGTVNVSATVTISCEAKTRVFSGSYSNSVAPQPHPVDTDIDTDVPPIPFVDLQ